MTDIQQTGIKKKTLAQSKRSILDLQNKIKIVK